MSASTVPAAAAQTASAPVPAAPGRILYPVIEGVVLLLVVLSPWAFGSVHPLFEFVLFAGVALVMTLWGLAMLLNGRVAWKRCPVALGLAGLVLFGALQLLPLPPQLLQMLSPETAATCARLLPAQREQLTPSDAAPDSTMPAGRCLSLYPGATRLAVLRLLAVFCLFAVVRNTFASPAGLRRLSVVALLNGVALAMFAMVQFFTTPHYADQSQRFAVYWIYPTDGNVFGPFIDRNHFPFYVNVCLGLGMGYVLAALAARPRSSYDRAPALSVRGLLDRPQALWVLAGLVVGLSAVVFSLSRGGFIALLGGALLGVVVLWCTAPRASGLAIWLVTGVLAFGLVAWFGWPHVEARLNSTWASPAKEGRIPMWLECLRVWQKYPVFGTGYGTFRYVEPLERPPSDDPDVDYVYAHNDYVEAAVEGGAVRLLLSLALIALVYRLGFRAYRHYKDRATGGLVLGAVVGFTTLVLHGFTEFGLHVPAIAFLATVLCAHLAALGARRSHPPGEAPVEAVYTLRLAGIAPLLGLSGAVLLAFVLAAEGWKLSQAERFRLAARNLVLNLKPGTPVPHERQIAYLDAATGFEPADAALQVALAEAHLDAWKEAAEGSPSHALEATRHYLLARSLCPLLPQPYERLAALTGPLHEADTPLAYLQRATLVRPADTHIWFLRGSQEIADNNLREEGCRSWGQSLRGSDKYLEDMVKAGRGVLTDEQWIDVVQPAEQPELTQRTAILLYPDTDPDWAKKRAPLLQAALELLQHRREGMKAKDCLLRARIQDQLGQTDEALKSYQFAVSRAGDPRTQRAWRLEMVRLLVRANQLAEAESTLNKVSPEQEGYTTVQRLLEDAKDKHKDKK